MAIEVHAEQSGFGAQVRGVDLTREEDFAPIHQAFLDHGVIYIRGQGLSPQAQVGFSRRFGPLLGRRPSTPDKVLMPGVPEVILLSNRKKNGEGIGIADAGRYWHSDLDFEQCPNLGTIVHAIEVPPQGGDALLDELFTHCLRDEFIYRHNWRVGDTVIWDNRRLMHNAEPYDMERYSRHMHRTSICGDKPF